MKQKWFYTILALGMIFAVLLGACATPAEQPTAAPGEPTAMPPAERKVASFIWTQEFDTLNPLYTNMWFSSITQSMWLTWPWEFDANNEPFPVMVTDMPSVENGGISTDGKTITINLRDDLKWSDGEPITSEDFVFTYEMAMDPKNAVASTYPYDTMASMEAPDERTVVINFTEPFAPWQSKLFHGILPAHILRPVFEAEGTIDNACLEPGTDRRRRPLCVCGVGIRQFCPVYPQRKLLGSQTHHR